MQDMIAELFNVVGGVSGLTSIGVLVWKGGGLVREVNEHERRIEIVEKHGSGSLCEHIKYDDERVQAVKDRITRLENILISLPDLQRDVAVINVKIDVLHKAIDDLLKRIAENKKGN